MPLSQHIFHFNKATNLVLINKLTWMQYLFRNNALPMASRGRGMLGKKKPHRPLSVHLAQDEISLKLLKDFFR